MPLWLARHALPLIAPGICYGALDLRADEMATRQAAQRLAECLPQGLHVRCSPLQRCEQLAQDLQALRPDLAYKIELRLREMDFGDWEGRAWQSIDPAAVAAWTDDFAHYRPGGGESVEGFMQRVAEVLAEIGTTATLWITHAGVIRAASLLARGQRRIDRADEWPQAAPAYGGWTLIERPARNPIS